MPRRNENEYGRLGIIIHIPLIWHYSESHVRNVDIVKGKAHQIVFAFKRQDYKIIIIDKIMEISHAENVINKKKPSKREN